MIKNIMKKLDHKSNGKIKTGKTKGNLNQKIKNLNKKNSFLILQNKEYIIVLKLFIYFLLPSIYYSKENSSDLRKLGTLPKITVVFDVNKGTQSIFSYKSEIIFNYLTIHNKDQIIDNVAQKYISFKSSREYNLIIEFHFNENQIVSFKNLFNGINTLTKVDFSQFNQKVSDMTNMFYNCHKLEYVNFGDFDSTGVTSMENMFYSTNIIFLDLSKFKTESVTKMSNMFVGNKNLLYLNLNKFNVEKVTQMSGMFSNCKSLQFLNLLSFKENSRLNADSLFNEVNSNLIYCIKSEKAPKISTELQKLPNAYNNCSEECFQEGKKLVPSKKICYSNCIEDEEYIYEFNNLCYNYPIEKESYTINENTENIENIENTENTETSTNQQEKDKQTDKTQNVIVEGCTSEDFFNGLCDLGTEELSVESKDKIINSIVENIENGNLDSIIEEVTSGEKDFFIQQDDIIFQITTTENQNKNEYNNISTIDLGDCEGELKSRYGINPNDSLIILKIDYFMEGLNIPIIGYEVFDPSNRTKLNLSYCKDFQINYNIPVSIEEDELSKYDPKSEYYKDECTSSTSNDGTDLTLNDRKNEYNEKNMSLCESKCNFTNYNISTKKSVCMCEIKSKIYTISEILSSKELISKEFNANEDSSSSVTNLNLMKCFGTLFTKYGLLKNIGNYVLLLIIVSFVVSSIFFYKVGYTLLENEIKQILSVKEANEKNISIYNFDRKKNKGKKKKKKSKKSSNYINHEFNPGKKKSLRKSVEQVDSINTGKEINHKSFTKIELKCQGTVNRRLSKVNEKENNARNPLLNIVYIDFELNNLSYEEALERDKRDFWEYYISLIKIKHPIIFTFYPNKDYNTFIIKLDLFMLFFAVIYAMNALFFTDSVIHQIYSDKGNYNFGYFLPKIILAFILSHIVNTIIKYIFLSERNVLEIKLQQTREQAYERVDDVKRCLTIKYIVFYILGALFLILFWYYLSSFGAVYKNSQTFLIINTFISSTFSLLYPFFINVFPAIFRINSLNNNNRKIFYTISKIFQMI